MKKYNPKDIEKKWQKKWDKEQTFAVKEDATKKKFYSLIEFPYPSGAGLHVGHPRPFTAMDVISRKKRMEGFNVLYPIGFDAFGLPTENYAIKTGEQPAKVTAANIKNFTRQLKSLGYSFDWSRVVDTTDPKYFKWTQWIFLQMYKHGLAYKKNQPINWCPKDKIGLANEEVVQGCCERCGTPVEQRNKEQWILGITQYADKLLEGLKEVDYITPARIQQENWIGKSEGAEVDFALRFVPGQQDDKHKVRVFTTRPDTIFGVTFVAVSAELAQSWLKVGWQASDKVKKYVEATAKERVAAADRDEQEKTGVDAGIKAINPVNGEEIPVWVTNYVMGGVGTGAIMGVPAHDERDFEFAKKFGLPVKQVVAPYIRCTGNREPRSDKETTKKNVVTAIIYNQDKGYLVLDWGNGSCGFVGGGIEAGETAEEAVKREIAEETGFSVAEVTPLLPAIYGHGYKPRKDVNCFDHDTLFIVKIENGAKQAALSAQDQGAHTISWKKDTEVSQCVTLDHHKFIWKNFIEKKSCFTEAGIAVNSDMLNGLETSSAKEKMITWLEAKGLGKRKVNFKLRDWVFSRQRYWGEPIPLVHCDACAKKKQKVLIIHGFEGNGEGNWLPWMKQELEKQGMEVFSPTLSKSDHPDVATWLRDMQPFIKQMGADDIIIGHSLGSKAALHLIEESNKKIGHVYLVASTIGSIGARNWDDFRKKWPNSDIDALKKFWTAPFDWKKIGSLVDNKTLILSNDDPFIERKTHEGLPTDWQLKVWQGHGHFQQKSSPELFAEIIRAKNTGWVPLPESELPLELPKVKKYEPTDTGESPLAAIEKWVKTKCPRCGGPARRETDTMPNWAGSSWYFLRYMDPHNDQALVGPDKLKYWNQVDWYNGGMEHTVLHLLYSRFWHQFLFDIGVVPTREPYKRRTSHGMILGPDGEKMSKSRGNVINPDDMVEQFGTDAFRTYIMFMGPFDQAVMWDTNGLVGVRRFLDRVWNLQEKVTDQNDKLTTQLHQMIKKVSEDIDGMRFNTAIAKMMEFVNEACRVETISKATYATLLQLLSPFAPHLAEELWENYGSGSLAYGVWPTHNPELAKDSSITLAIQVNGKVRDTLEVSPDITEEAVKAQVLANEVVIKWLDGKQPKKVIYVKGKLVSIVV